MKTAKKAKQQQERSDAQARAQGFTGGTIDCKICGLPFKYTNATAPDICGAFDCRRRFDLDSPEKWEGAARMAVARKAAGVVLTSVDEEALRRIGVSA